MITRKKSLNKVKKRRSSHFYVNTEGVACKKTAALLGKGVFGSTYRMKHRIDRGIYAVKHIQAPILEEVQALVRICHPNIVRYYSCEKRRDKSLRVVMELVGDGTTLKDVLGTFGFRNSRMIIQQIADALCYLHNINILHRDLKSGNIFVDGHSIKIGDFGHAIFLTNDNVYNPKPKTQGRSHYAYRAPEVLHGAKYGPRSDMFQLGCIFLELRTGIDLDTIVGNSATTGWGNTATSWLVTPEGQESIEDICDTEHDTPFLATCITLLDSNPERRPSAQEVYDKLKITNIPRLPSIRPQTA